MRSVEEIFVLFKQRKAQSEPWRSRALEVKSVYNHEASIPLPELNKDEKAFVANLLAQGMDQLAARIASTIPSLQYPALRPGFKKSEELAATRRKANLGWWSQNNMKLKLRRRARWLIGYASSPAWISWDFERGIPRWDIRDPLDAYPAQTNDPDELCPPDSIYTFTRPYRWLKDRYPSQVAAVYTGRDTPKDEHFMLLRYDDAEETVVVLLGKDIPAGTYTDWTTGTEKFAELERIPNRAGMCLVVHPGRITLDRPQGQFDGMVGMYQQQAMLMALEVIAVKRSIFPDEWLIGDTTTPQILSPANGLTGQIGIAKGGKPYTPSYVPGPQAPLAIDRLERNARVTAGLPAEFGGEGATNIRTGRRGDQVLSAAVDFPLQEAQEILAASLAEENRRAVAVAKAYGGNARKTFWVPWKGSQGRVDYVPNQIFETDENYVAYAMSGVDQSGLIIGIGQRIGTGLMSKATGREIDPLIDDAEQENDRIQAEAMEGALLASFTQQASQGVIPPVDVARVMQLVETNQASLAEAITKAHEEAQKRQAEQAPPQSPEAQAGLGAPGMGAEQPTIPNQMGSSLGNLSMLLQNLRGPQRSMPGEPMGETALQAAPA